MTDLLTSEEIEAFRRDGAVLLKSALPDEWVGVVRDGLDDAIASPDALSADLGSLRVDQFPAARVDALGRFVRDSPVAQIVGTMLNAPVRFYMDQLFHKPPGLVPPTPWHQDTCYYNLGGHDVVRAWVSPDVVPRHLSLEVVRGSHLWNATYSPLAGRDPSDSVAARRTVDTAEPGARMLGAEAYAEWTYWSGVKDESLPAVPNIESSRESFDIIGWDYEPGDVLLFHGNILHSALGDAVSETQRRAHASIWLGNDVHYRHRLGQVIPDPIGLYDHEPATGQPLSDFPDVFPVHWAPADQR
jgi:ectoine hydroxylase-related dioxygenase (phytanoyl-CoA dioxygenase family)